VGAFFILVYKRHEEEVRREMKFQFCLANLSAKKVE